jgi:hypothetical protein
MAAEFRLNTEELFADSLANHELDAYSSVNEAYESLLINRESETLLHELNDDEKLCNLNLKTAVTFKALNEKYAALTKSLRILNQDTEDNTEIFFTTNNNIRKIQDLSKKYNSESLEKVQDFNEKLEKEYLSTKLKIQNEIEKQKGKLEVEMDFLKMKINSLRSLIVSGISEMVNKDDANNKKLCPVCFDREVDMAMVPCGHTCCTGCSKFNTSSKCMQCRSTVHTRLKLFFSV